MSQAALKASHAVTIRHLAASRFYLPETLPTQEAEGCWQSMWEFMHHNELGLALDYAIELGDFCSAPREYWAELRFAAVNMGLHDQALLLQDRL
jgi:hypothetical protein